MNRLVLTACAVGLTAFADVPRPKDPPKEAPRNALIVAVVASQNPEAAKAQAAALCEQAKALTTGFWKKLQA